MRTSDNLRKAKKARRDEFYTQRQDIDLELSHYEDHFRNKVVFCNTDKPSSHFVKYFEDNYTKLGLRGLELESSDFRGDVSVAKHRKSDIIVTNPPFSLFREFADQLIDLGKGFLIIGNLNAMCYRDFFTYMMEGKAWLGTNIRGNCHFEIPMHYESTPSSWEEDGKKFVKLSIIRWFTNLSHFNHPKPRLETEAVYTPEAYPRFDNWEDIINVNRIKDIPCDYPGLMGVPITFLDRWNPEQFELLGLSGVVGMGKERNKTYESYLAWNEDGTLNKRKYRRIHDHPFIEGLPPKGGVRYVHKDTGHTLHALYKRIFIKRVD